MSFYKIKTLTPKERRGLLNLTELYTDKQLTERRLLDLLRKTLSTILPDFVSSDFLELISNFRNYKTPLVLIEGELFENSMPLIHTQEFVGTKILMPQEVLALIMGFLVGHSFGIKGERLEMVQRGAKIAGYPEPRNVAGTGERDFHVDGAHNQNQLADILVFLLNNSHGFYTQFTAVLSQELDRYKVGNYSLLEILKRPDFETISTLNCLRLQDKPPAHSVITSHDYQFARFILNENTVLGREERRLIDTDLPNRWSELALSVFKELLVQNKINLPYNIALVSQTLGQTVPHAVKRIPDDRQKEVCADPENPKYLDFRELLRVYIAKLVNSKNWVKREEGLELLDGTYTNVVTQI